MRMDRGRPVCQRTRCLRSATLATSEPASWFCTQHWARAAERRLVTVERPGGSSCRAGKSGSWSSGTARACVEDRQDLLAPVQKCGAVEVAQGFEVAAIAGLALGDGHEQIVADDLAQRPVLPPRLVFAPLGEPPGHLQTAAAELVQARQPPPAVLVGSLRRSTREDRQISASAHAVRSELSQTVREMIGQIEQMADVVECVIELGRSERPMPPVGACLAAGQADAQHLADQVDQR